MRCYNGAPDSELKAFLDDCELAERQLAAADMRATYFPMEGKWAVFNGRHMAVTGFFPTKRSAADAALGLLIRL